MKQKISLFKSIKPLFSNKPLVLVANKIDQVKFEDLSPPNKAMLEEFVKENNIEMIQTSTVTEEGLITVKEKVFILFKLEFKFK